MNNALRRLGGIGTALVLVVALKPGDWPGQDQLRASRTAATCTIPAPPGDVELTAGADRSITVSWSASAGATRYDVYRGIKPGGEGKTPIASTTRTTYRDRHHPPPGTGLPHPDPGHVAGRRDGTMVALMCTPVGRQRQCGKD